MVREAVVQGEGVLEAAVLEAVVPAPVVGPAVDAQVSVPTAAAAKARGNPPAATAKPLAAARATIAKAHAAEPVISDRPAESTTGERDKTPAAATLIPVSRDEPAARINARAAAMIG